MKATLNKSDLALHGKRLKLSQPTKSVAAKGGVEISASLEITIMGPGFSKNWKAWFPSGGPSSSLSSVLTGYDKTTVYDCEND